MSRFRCFWRLRELANEEMDLIGLFKFRSFVGRMPFRIGPIMGKHALTMATHGSTVDQISASTAVHVGSAMFTFPTKQVRTMLAIQTL